MIKSKNKILNKLNTGGSYEENININTNTDCFFNVWML